MMWKKRKYNSALMGFVRPHCTNATMILWIAGPTNTSVRWFYRISPVVRMYKTDLILLK
jgi:hypothetical protein